MPKKTLNKKRKTLNKKRNKSKKYNNKSKYKLTSQNKIIKRKTKKDE